MEAVTWSKKWTVLSWGCGTIGIIWISIVKMDENGIYCLVYAYIYNIYNIYIQYIYTHNLELLPFGMIFAVK